MKPGIHYGITYAEYAQIDAVSSSALRDLRVSPRNYWRKRQMPDQDSDTYRIGRASHTAILEPLRFLREYVLWEAKTKNGSGKIAPRHGEQWDTFTALHEGKTVLTVEQYTTAVALRDAVHADPLTSKWLAGQAAKHEVTLVWNDPRTGVLCKARPDRVDPGEALTDVKTAADPVPRRFAATAARLGYHIQAAHYGCGWHALTGETLPFRFIVPQTREPFDVVGFPLGAASLTRGEEERDELIDRLIECREINEWPGLSNGEPVELNLPAYAFDDDILDEPINYGTETIG